MLFVMLHFLRYVDILWTPVIQVLATLSGLPSGHEGPDRIPAAFVLLLRNRTFEATRHLDRSEDFAHKLEKPPPSAR